MSSAKIIENPEIPGLECFLPPPPPPPLPATSPKNNNVPIRMEPRQEQQQEPITMETTTTSVPANNETTANLTTPTPTPTPTVQGPVTSFPTVPVPTPYIIHPAMQPQTPGQPATPWWVPTDADTSDLYARWYDTTYKATAVAIASPPIQVPSKPKNKHHKRKNEFIDPAQDAEKVASAQRELSALMKPLKCDLCNAVMNSTLQAKLHYDGKPHQKKVSMFLNQSVKKLKTEDGQVNSTTNDWQNYCDICKTWFTSQTDATQHYAGKKHVRAANGGRRARPSKKSRNQSQYNQLDPSGRFAIGVSFQADVPSAAPVQPVIPEANTALVASTPGTGAVYTPPSHPTPLRCDLCGVSANRQDQLETHKRGARHLRMLKLNGLPVPESAPSPIVQPRNIESTNISTEHSLATENESIPAIPGPIDYSIYRTPSGQYYCAPCNLSLNSESTFAQHVESKKHKNQSNPKSPSNAAVVSKKAKCKKK